jgi:hypothetical protein
LDSGADRVARVMCVLRWTAAALLLSGGDSGGCTDSIHGQQKPAAALSPHTASCCLAATAVWPGLCPLTGSSPCVPALQESFLVCHTQAVLDAIQSDKRIATATVLETVVEVLQELQAIQEAAAALPSGSSKQHSKAQQTGADVDLKLFKKLRQVVVLLGALMMLSMHAAMARLVRRVMRLCMHAAVSCPVRNYVFVSVPPSQLQGAPDIYPALALSREGDPDSATHQVASSNLWSESPAGVG